MFTDMKEEFEKESQIFNLMKPSFNAKSAKIDFSKNPEHFKPLVDLRMLCLERYHRICQFRKMNLVQDYRLKMDLEQFKGGLEKIERKLERAETVYLRCLDDGKENEECLGSYAEIVRAVEKGMRKEFDEKLFL